MPEDSRTAATPVELTCAGVADAVTAARWRGTLRRWLQEATEATVDLRDDIVLAVNEALANCVEHAYHAHPTAGPMRLRASHDPAARSISVCVSDRGSWHRQSPKRLGDPWGSRGIMLMHALADHCTISARPNGTTVCLDYTTAP
jgi:anti-sigma regulatory factor (Ser/Thr protein kinase)